MKTPFLKIYMQVCALTAEWAIRPFDFEIRSYQLRYLSDNGWTDLEFDQYLLRMIDSGWEGIPKMPTWLNLFKRKLND